MSCGSLNHTDEIFNLFVREPMGETDFSTTVSAFIHHDNICKSNQEVIQVLNVLYLGFQISDVHKEGCKLKWKRPKDDGGTPIEYYQVEKMDPESGCWVPCGRATEPSK